MIINGKPFVYTFTNVNTYDICPRQMYARYVAKSVPFKSTPEMEFGNKVHTAFELRVGGGKPLPADMNQWEPFCAPLDGLMPRVEVKMGITRDGRPTGFYDNDVFFRGKADVIVIQATAAFLPDWKTGKCREEPFELETNAMLTHVANPYLTSMTGAYVWLKENRMGMPHNLSNTSGTWTYLNRKIAAIENSMQTNDWPEKKTPLCAWCDDFSCPHNKNPKKP